MFLVLSSMLITTLVIAGIQKSHAHHVLDGEVTVVQVVDGDTIRVQAQDGQRYLVRYIGIDAPELHHPTRGLDCWAREASDRNRELVQDAIVYLEPEISDVDRFGRLLRHVWVGEQLMGTLLIAEGHARAYPYAPDLGRSEEYASVEHAAKQERRGFWGGCIEASSPSDLDDPAAEGPPAYMTPVPTVPARATPPAQPVSTPITAPGESLSPVQDPLSRVPRPDALIPPWAPAGTTAQCRDGSFSFSPFPTRACTGHGGVARWYRP